jgi:hypothetical protein
MKNSRTPTAAVIVLARCKNSGMPAPLTLEEAWTLARNASQPEWRNFALHRLMHLGEGDVELDRQVGTFLKEQWPQCALGVLKRYARFSRVQELRAWAQERTQELKRTLGLESQQKRDTSLKKAA